MPYFVSTEHVASLVLYLPARDSRVVATFWNLREGKLGDFLVVLQDLISSLITKAFELRCSRTQGRR
jgi:hypothetical protein